MNIRSRHRREPETAPLSGFHSSLLTKLFSAEEFELELSKEISRSNRRQFSREFAVIRFPTVAESPHSESLAVLCDQVQQRIRVSDSIGWFHGTLAVLLPETAHPGALSVVNKIIKQFSQAKPGAQPLLTEIIIYPWDDELISLSTELNLTAPNQESDHFNADAGEMLFENSPRMSDNETEGQDFGGSSSNGNGIVATLERHHVLATGSEPVSLGNELYSTSRISDHGLRLGTRLIECRRTPILKRSVDVLAASAGLALLTPVFIAAAAAIKVTSKGPIFFRQKREGKDGKVFGILKFRTMIVDAEQLQANLRHISEQDGPAFKLTKDPRVTWIGRFLRKSCVDELPQLWNIVRGDMSLVGPRPLPVGESLGCKAWHRSRLTVLPGLTCTWQASGRRKDIKFDDWMRMDLDYIKKRSFWFDLRLLVRTAFIALLHKGSV